MMVHCTLDPASSRFTVQAFAAGMLSGLGHSPTFAIRDFTGELRFTPDALAEAFFHLAVTADSLTLTDAVSPKDREEIERTMHREVLETATYPEIVFQTTAIKADKVVEGWYRLQLAGELCLHGVKKVHTVEAQLRLSEDRGRLSGRSTLSQAAYRIKPVSALGGLIRLKDELRLEFDLACRNPDG
jgi:polyisoprenoid-binding protein YceI